jgi:hypothetical protein
MVHHTANFRGIPHRTPTQIHEDPEGPARGAASGPVDRTSGARSVRRLADDEKVTRPDQRGQNGGPHPEGGPNAQVTTLRTPPRATLTPDFLRHDGAHTFADSSASTAGGGRWTASDQRPRARRGRDGCTRVGSSGIFGVPGVAPCPEQRKQYSRGPLCAWLSGGFSSPGRCSHTPGPDRSGGPAVEPSSRFTYAGRIVAPSCPGTRCCVPGVRRPRASSATSRCTPLTTR